MIESIFPMIIGEEEVLTENDLLTHVENGPLMECMDSIRFIVVHCSATRITQDYTVEQLLRDHLGRGFRKIGYHFYIRKNGEMTQHRQLLEVGAHAYGYNRCSVSVCYEGGLNAEGSPADTRTPEQKRMLREQLRRLHRLFPDADILGHRDLPGVHKSCPCFDVCDEYDFLRDDRVDF